MRDELNNKILKLVDNVKSKILDQAENAEDFELALKEMKKSLTEEYNKSLNEIFESDGTKISSILHIPFNILLKEDLPVKKGIDGDINKIKEEIETLKKAFQSLLYLKQELLEELQDADSAIIFMENFISHEKFSFDVLPVEEMCELSRANKVMFDAS